MPSFGGKGWGFKLAQSPFNVTFFGVAAVPQITPSCSALRQAFSASGVGLVLVAPAVAAGVAPLAAEPPAEGAAPVSGTPPPCDVVDCVAVVTFGCGALAFGFAAFAAGFPPGEMTTAE